MQWLHALIHGRVQGVSFRYHAQHTARRLGLHGWVRNCADGTVETLAEGEHTALEQYLLWLHNGPSGAHVTHVNLHWYSQPPTSIEPSAMHLTEFDIRYDDDHTY